MDLHFNEGERFCLNDGSEYEVVHIDYSDEEYPYECYPVEIIEKTKNILQNGVLVNEEEGLWEHKDEDGEVYEFYQGDKFNNVIYEWFPDDRYCLSDYHILEYKYEQLQKEFDALKDKMASFEDCKFNIGDTFIVDGQKWEIVDIYVPGNKPYACYPVELVEKTKNILANGVLVDEEEGFCEFNDEDGDVYHFDQGEDLSTAMFYFFSDKCWFCSEDKISEYTNPVDRELLDKIEQDEEGYVCENINGFFDYMFSEEWTFGELVDKLTPAMKEELIFNTEWNGSVGKVNGKYYYHPDIESLKEQPSINEVVENAVRKSETSSKGVNVKENVEKGLE